MLQVTIVIDEGGLPKYATRYHYLSPMYGRPGGTFSNQAGPRGPPDWLTYLINIQQMFNLATDDLAMKLT